MTGKNAQAYVYDPGGNMSDMDGEPFGYGAGNRLTSYDGQTLTFDADGNMTYGPLGGAFAHFEYDGPTVANVRAIAYERRLPVMSAE